MKPVRHDTLCPSILPEYKQSRILYVTILMVTILMVISPQSESGLRIHSVILLHKAYQVCAERMNRLGEHHPLDFCSEHDSCDESGVMGNSFCCL